VRPRFYVPDLDSRGEAVLGAEEAAHLVRVLRLGAGAEIDVFDGRGGMFRATVVEVARARVRLAIGGLAAAAPEPGLQVTLVMSALKGDKMDDVVRDAAMMGIAAVQPVVSARSEVGLATLQRGHRAQRWTRIAIASVKQCGRAVVPTVREPIGLDAWIAGGPAEPTLVLQEPSRGPAHRLRDVPISPAARLLVGPEGGWTRQESTAFEAAGFHAVSLGGRTLRADAAPIVVLAALYEAWDGW
jgi:16S rRNA (uracil1498-N3)-methyltransferase